MKAVLELILFVLFCYIIIYACEGAKDPYEVGPHAKYTISCENGHIYKIYNRRRGVIQVFNSDGTPLKCGEKIY